MKHGLFYDNLDEILNHAWSLIETGVSVRKSPHHTPAFCSIGLDGSPQCRILVLRNVNKAHSIIRFNTDSRSPKVAEIQANPKVSVLMYDAETKIQLRLSGIARVENSGPNADQIWSASDRYARRCYLAEAAPSSKAELPTSGLPVSVAGRKPEEEELITARENFALLYVDIQKIDWLYLASEGHRRAVFEYNYETQLWSSHWVIP